MLITSSNGFLSVVNKPNEVDHLIVRAKFKGDLSRLFDDCRIWPTQDPDFPFAISICKQEFVGILIKMVKSIDYTNFSTDLIAV
ncbi:hypothetical protein [Echinicola pacifica]|uniref:hypothetical protein n=1 Tax=Echinicola pacifica TaxID=346377 RepID=UPI00035C47B8|nr:hypothetical protein [Echinicola pacifica]